MRRLTLSTPRARVSRSLLLSAILFVPACSQHDATAPIPPVTEPLHISGVMTAQSQGLRVFRAGAAVTDAVVTVNGVVIPHYAEDFYTGELPEAVPAGLPLKLKVSSGGVTVEATGNVPEAPVLTAPESGTVFTLNDAVTVTWTSAADPSHFNAFIGVGPDWGRSVETPGTARQANMGVVPASLLEYFQLFALEPALGISVFAVNEASFTGRAHSDSRIFIEGRRSTGTITVSP